MLLHLHQILASGLGKSVRSVDTASAVLEVDEATSAANNSRLHPSDKRPAVEVTGSNKAYRVTSSATDHNPLG